MLHRIFPNRNPLIRNRNSSNLRIDRSLGSGGTLGLFIADGNNSMMAGIDIKILVDIFEGAVCGLGVEEVDDGHKEEIECGEDNVEAVADVSDARGRELRADEAKEPVERCCCCGASGAHGQGVDFSLVNPRDHAPGATECCIVEKEEGNCYGAPLNIEVNMR
jgi:hypothetical protein